MERRARGVDGVADLVGAGLRCLVDDLLGRRVDDGVATRGGLDPLAVDVEPVGLASRRRTHAVALRTGTCSRRSLPRDLTQRQPWAAPPRGRPRPQVGATSTR